MVSRTTTVAFLGMDAHKVDVQAHFGPGMPSFQIVGLPDKAIGESRERVRAAIAALGLALPAKRITINLAPADLAKTGSHYDLPIALALLSEMGILTSEDNDEFIALGELALDGRIGFVPGILPAAFFATQQERSLICPKQCGYEATFGGENLNVVAADNLGELIHHLRGTRSLPPPSPPNPDSPVPLDHAPDMVDIKGQEHAKRAIEIAACGGHNVLMRGPPGAGKSMLASRLWTLLPPLTPRESLDVSMIHSLAGTLPNGTILYQRPYRAPHHSASLVALIGGDSKARPGEVSLTHRGVLFLDELPEFSRATLEALRQPLESGEVLISRAQARFSYPARFQLVAAMNPCPCGYHGESNHHCRCKPHAIDSYQNRISGPLYDRIDIHIDMPALSAKELMGKAPPENSTTIAERVHNVRELQRQRFLRLGADTLHTNAEADGKLLTTIAPLESAAQQTLASAIDQMNLSARAYHRILRIARTICDMETLDADQTISAYHIAQALEYKRRLAIEA
ncbi:MAG: YifB family Mg chelatase-like AAA ATPase [Alphaproteobacteria bacterium GM202ARS2]|nr:YifB family Mg chelatase-like AAA ATPase [Alphaproteobacteria bacterium GM202ARS2]